MRLISKEQEELVLQNLRLVNYIVNRLDIPRSELEDIQSIGNIGLIKAAITFDKSKNVKFSTYAIRCINNEIHMYFRKEKKHARNISLSEIISMNGKKELILEEMIPSTNEDFIEEIGENEDFVNCLNIILNLLKPKETVIALYRMAGLKQPSIGKILGISQSYISRMEKRIRKKLKQYFTNDEPYNKTISVRKNGEKYQISFEREDIKQFNKILTKVVQKLKSEEALLPKFNIKSNQKRPILNISGYPEDFYFIAEIIREINEYDFYNERES